MIDFEQARFIDELERLIEKSLPSVKKIEPKTFGMKIFDGDIVGIGLYDCGLKTIPESIRNLSKLEILNLDYNKLTTLPEAITNLFSLKELRLFHNKGTRRTALDELLNRILDAISKKMVKSSLGTLTIKTMKTL